MRQPPESEALTPEAVGALAAKMGLSLPDGGAERLAAFGNLLQRWNATYNLTALRGASQVLTHHLADCLAIVTPLRREVGDRRVQVLDVGSGGGLPGVVLAILFPEWQITCIDTVAKKVAFIRQVAAELALPNLLAVHHRVERFSGAFDVITSRAFATLSDFSAWTLHLLAPQGVWLAMKGRVPEEEIAALPEGVKVFHVEHLQVPGVNAERCLVWLKPVS